MKIITSAESIHEIFGYKTKNEMLKVLMDVEYLKANKTEAALIAILMKMEDMGVAPTTLLLLVLCSLTGLSINGPAELIEYFSKTMSESELVTLSAEITSISEDDDFDFDGIIGALEGILK